MSLIAFLTIILATLVLSEPSPLQFLLCLTLFFVFLIVIMVSSFARGCLAMFLVTSLIFIVGVFISTVSLFVFLIAFEFSLLPVSLLVLLLGYQPEKLSGVTWLITYTVICSSPLLYFCITNPLSIYSSFISLSGYAATLVSLSFIVKSPLYTLHSWLPKAHVEAPLSGSMLLAGVMLKLGGYGLLLLAPTFSGTCSLYVYLSLIGGVVCSVLCFRHWDMKSLVAYSSVVHMGVVTLGALSGLELGMSVASGIIVGHSLLSPTLFVLASDYYKLLHSRCFVLGYKSSAPATLLLATASCSGLNFGLPPFLNFWVEVSLYTIVGYVWSYSLFLLILISLLSFLYCILLYVFTCGGPTSFSSSDVSSSYIFIPPLVISFLLSFSLSALNTL